MSHKFKITTTALIGIALLIMLLCLVFVKIHNQNNIQAAIGINGFNENMPVTDKQILADLAQSLYQSQPATLLSGYRLALRYILLTTNKQTQKFYYRGNQLIYEGKPIVLRLTPEAATRLNKAFEILGSKLYGEYLSWAEASKILPRKGIATVVDFETGLSFRVQRRGGSYHADVEPLTPRDTMTMKEIYGGKWSWRRRAVIIQVNDIRIAASMNGMPHGFGEIRDNKFPGHSCIHFSGSRVHKSGMKDLAHQLMIAKAAGKLEERIWQAQPQELIAVFYTALKQHDWGMASLTLSFADPKEVTELEKNLSQIGDIKDFTVSTVNFAQHDLSVKLPVNLTWCRTGEQSYTTTRLFVELARDSLQDRWYIEAASVKL